MRITARIASHGERWGTQFPRIDASKCFPVDPKTGHKTADATECMRQLNSPMIVHSGSDTRFLHSVVCEWIAKVNGWKSENEMTVDDSNRESVDHTLDRLATRYERERITYSRATWSVVAPGDQLKVRIEYANPGDTTETEQWERLFASILADAARCVSEELKDAGYKPLIMTAETLSLLDWLDAWRADRAREREDAELKRSCPNRCGGLCAPAKFACRHFSAGRCGLA